jgi:hypothetical protein
MFDGVLSEAIGSQVPRLDQGSVGRHELTGELLEPGGAGVVEIGGREPANVSTKTVIGSRGPATAVRARPRRRRDRR